MSGDFDDCTMPTSKDFDHKFKKKCQNSPGLPAPPVRGKTLIGALYSDIVNEHAPIKQFHLRGNQVSFMSEKWRRKAIPHRNMLWKKFIQIHTDELYEKKYMYFFAA